MTTVEKLFDKTYIDILKMNGLGPHSMDELHRFIIYRIHEYKEDHPVI